jgi:multimeric flavodoxin WrbA
MTKVTILIGSPRREGSTSILAREAERGLKDQGIETELVFLNDLNIRGCQACNYCKKNDVTDCAVKDDMQKIHKLVQESDGLIVASPVYFSSVTAQTKAWLDRMYPYVDKDLVPKLPASKKVSFIFTQTQPDERLFKDGIGAFMYAVGMSGMTVKDHLVAGDLDAGFKPPVTGRKDLLDKAYRIGRNLLA